MAIVSEYPAPDDLERKNARLMFTDRVKDHGLQLSDIAGKGVAP